MNSIMDLLFLLYLTASSLFNAVENLAALTPCLLFTLILLGGMRVASSYRPPHRSWEWWLWETVRLPAAHDLLHRQRLLSLCHEMAGRDMVKSVRDECRAVERWAGTPFNWEFCTTLLLLGSPKSKRRARKAFVGDEWADFVKAVPPAERVAIYEAALLLQVERRQGDNTTALLWPEERVAIAGSRAKKAYGGAP